MALVKIIQKKQSVTRVKKVSVSDTSSTVAVKKPRVTTRKKVIKTISPEEIVPTEFTVGVWVFMNDKVNSSWEGDYATIARKNKVPCKVLSTPNGGSVSPDATTSILLMNMPSFGHYVSSNFNYPLSGFTLISKKEADDTLNELIKKHEAAFEQNLANVKKIFDTPHVPILERTDYDLKIGLDTNYNYVGLGKIQKDLSFSFSSTGHKYQNARCCALSKTTSDIVTWIPVSWLTYMGYNEKDLNLWIDFCKNLGIGFDATLVRKVKFTDIFGKGFQSQPIPENVSPNIRNFLFLPRTEEAYEVVLRGSSRMETYMHFILLRYIYNNFYSTIPFTAMQLKMKLRDKATFWECLLLAHNNISKTGSYVNYYGYYCLTACTDVRGVFANKGNSVLNVMGKVKAGSCDMNSSFAYTSVNTSEISKIIRSGTDEEILGLIEKYRTK